MTRPGQNAAPLDRRALLEVGRVLKPHGLRGEVRARLHWSDSTALFEVERVVLHLENGEEREWTLESARSANRGVLLCFSGIEDVEAAERLRDAEISVFRADLPPLGPDEYYLSDLVGAEVIAPDGVVGTVVELGLHPTIDTLVIQTEGGARVEQPVASVWIGKVDIDHRRVELTSRDGLIV